jgi:hypothetical protein
VSVCDPVRIVHPSVCGTWQRGVYEAEEVVRRQLEMRVVVLIVVEQRYSRNGASIGGPGAMLDLMQLLNTRDRGPFEDPAPISHKS